MAQALERELFRASLISFIKEVEGRRHRWIDRPCLAPFASTFPQGSGGNRRGGDIFSIQTMGEYPGGWNVEAFLGRGSTGEVHFGDRQASTLVPLPGHKEGTEY